MALDLVSAPLPLDSRPKKRPRLAWDDPGPAFNDEVGRLLPIDLVSRLFFAQPAVYSGQDAQGKGGVAGHSSATVAGSGLALTSVYINGSTRVASPPLRDDDKDGHYNFELGENLTSRYKILSKMGEGTFGRVLECWDREAREYVAIKVVRSVQKYRDAAMIEVDVLRALGKNDKSGSRGCLQMRSWFDYRNHICIVCEKLGPSLFDFLRINNYRPFSVDLVREFGRQLLESVAYMHGLNLIHTDLKPENVLLVSADYTKVVDHKKTTDHVLQMKRVPKSSRIKVIDFGSATYDSQYNYSVVSTRHYRAPEVILGLGWSYSCDIWSVGCILIELCTGEALFQTHENLEHLAMMERVLGPIPSHIIRKSVRRAEKYFRHGGLNWPEGAASRESIRAVRRLLRLRNLVMQHADHSAGLLIDLLQGLLKYESSERPTAKEALEHPFFRSSSR